jgi:hypothetical protein
MFDMSEETKPEDEILVAAANVANRLLPDLYAKRAELFSKIQVINWQIKQYDNVIAAAGLTEAAFTRDLE